MPLDPGVTYSIPLDIRDFKPPLDSLNKRTGIDVTAEELVIAAMMVGYPVQRLDLWALLHRAAMVLGYLDGPDGLRRSSDYDGADPSEKHAISYYLGLFAAKIVAARLLDVPWLIHYDHFLRSRGQQLTGTRPDLLGLSDTAPSAWYVVEAKGRSDALAGRALDTKLAKAKSQLAGAQVPGRLGASIASIAHFAAGKWQVALCDADVVVDQRWDSAAHIRVRAAYYEQVLRFVRELARLGRASSIQLGTNDDAVPYTEVIAPRSDVHVAVPTAAVDALTDGPIVPTDAGAGHHDELVLTAARAVITPFLESRTTLLGDPDERASDPDREWIVKDVATSPSGSPWAAAAPIAFDDAERRWTLGTDGVAVRLDR